MWVSELSHDPWHARPAARRVPPTAPSLQCRHCTVCCAGTRQDTVRALAQPVLHAGSGALNIYRPVHRATRSASSTSGCKHTVRFRRSGWHHKHRHLGVWTLCAAVVPGRCALWRYTPWNLLRSSRTRTPCSASDHDPRGGRLPSRAGASSMTSASPVLYTVIPHMPSRDTAAHTLAGFTARAQPLARAKAA